MLQHVKEMREKGTFQDGWSQGMMRSLPKEPGNLSVEKQRPIMLLNTRAKWATMILKLGMDDYLRAIIPMAQRGFVPGRSMDAHLHEVHEIQREGKTGCWVAMDFRKAFDTVSHPMLEAFLLHAGLPKQWVSVIMSFLKGPIGFLVGNKVSPEWIRPGGGIRQGDTLSPALFALLTALLCRKLQQKMPQARPFLYADDTLVWIEGSPTEVQASVRKLKGIMQEYGDHTGQRLNISKCAVILQGD
jgi:hypothetical protein